jgi:hypothetical protein
MDYTTVILGTLALAALVGLAWMGGYELGQAAGVSAERDMANRRVNGVLDALNTRRPKAARNRRKAQRKAARV